jgi:hypothetical protein
MKQLTVLFFFIACIILTSVACQLPVITPVTPIPTNTSMPPSPTRTQPSNIPNEPSATPLPPPQTPTTIPPTLAPVEPHLQPAGMVVAPATGGNVFLYDRNIQLIGQYASPSFNNRMGFSHLAGSLTGQPAPLALVYYTYESSSLMVTDSQGPQPLRNVPGFFAMCGIPGEAYIAFSSIEYADTGLSSALIAGNLDGIPNAPVIMTVLDTDGYAVRPLAIRQQDGQPVGVYYTSVPYGIGGDIVFEPRRALQFYDISTYVSQQVLGIGESPVGISPDLEWIAYTSVNVSPIRIALLANPGAAVTIPLLEDSDRGAGAAVFSPDNRYVAWKEGSGFSMSDTPNFHAIIRIATTSGEVIGQIDDTTLSALVGGIDYPWVEPVGWLDSETLLIELRGYNWEDAYLLRVAPDGSNPSLLVTGSFVGFIYP